MNIICKLIIVLTTFVYCATTAKAQTHDDKDGGFAQSQFDESALQRIMPTRYGGNSRKWRDAQPIDEQNKDVGAYNDVASSDSLHLPKLNSYGQPQTISRYPLCFDGWYSWGLHKGLNMQLGASVFTQFGKGARGGAGFGQNISLMYAMPLTEKLSVAIGGYLNNVNYAGDNWHDVGLSAVLGYRFNDHWEAYVFGQKSITNNVYNRLNYAAYGNWYNGMGCGYGRFGGFGTNFYGFPAYSAYELGNMGDRIGATVRYNVNSSMSIEVTVENRWMRNHP